MQITGLNEEIRYLDGWPKMASKECQKRVGVAGWLKRGVTPTKKTDMTIDFRASESIKIRLLGTGDGFGV